MSSRFAISEANEQYEKLKEYTAIREREISGMVGPYISLTDRYGSLIAGLTLILGRIKPANTQDVVIRDLMADVFDFLYEARALVLSGKCTVAYPLARRAYESLSLLHLCALDPKWAERWSAGQQISNRQVRRGLASHSMGEAEQNTKELYNFFCSATHPNRELILDRRLGNGNQFVLGAVGQPNPVMDVDYLIKLLAMWFWFAAAVSYFYRSHQDRSYGETYLAIAEDAREIASQLVENFNRLLAEAKQDREREGAGG